MEGELEAIRQQLLNHRLPLFVVGLPFPVGLRGQIELLGFDPGRRAGDLLGMNPVGEGDQIGQRRIDGGKLAASHHESLARPVRRGGLDGGDFKLRIRIRGHRLRRRRRFRNRPGGLRRGTLQVQGKRLGSLLPVPRDRVSVGLQLSLVGAANPGHRHLHGRTLQRDRVDRDALAALIDAVHRAAQRAPVCLGDLDDRPQFSADWAASRCPARYQSSLEPATRLPTTPQRRSSRT